MFWIRTWVLGVKSLLLHPLRSALTVLGIFIGVASVIWLVAVGEGISQEAQRQIEGLGAENIIIRSVKPPSEATSGFSGPVPYGLKREEFDTLVATIPHLKSALPIREIRRQIHCPEREPVDGRFVGCTPEYLDVNRLVVDRGRFIEEPDVQNKQNFCVLAAKLAEELFPVIDPLGQRVYLPEHRDYYQVVGVLKHRQASAAIGGSFSAQDYSMDMYVPISTLRQFVGDFIVRRGNGTFEVEVVELNQITLRVDGVERVRATADLVRDTLGVAPIEKDASEGGGVVSKGRSDLAIVVPDELLEQARVTRLMFMLFMFLIAGISLLVGGIGIMNIMLATVTERTREIGIRRALGATRLHIIAQFLVETISLSVVGGLVGILGGLVCLPAMSQLRDMVTLYNPELMSKLPDVIQRVEPTVVPWTIPVSFFISVSVGILFGIYPAIRAAYMDPIEALRHE